MFQKIQHDLPVCCCNSRRFLPLLYKFIGRGKKIFCSLSDDTSWRLSALILLFHYAAILASLSSLSSSGEIEKQNVWAILYRELRRFCSLPASMTKLAKKYEIIANITNVFRNLAFHALLLPAGSDTIQIHSTILFPSIVSPNTLELSI